MKKYNVKANINAGATFKPAIYVTVGIVEAESKAQALKKAQQRDFKVLYVTNPQYANNFPFKISTSI